MKGKMMDGKMMPLSTITFYALRAVVFEPI